MEFSQRYNEKTGSHFKGKVDREFIIRMVYDELEELKEAKDEAEEVDALLDATYYILNHLAGTGLDIRPIWTMIHKANMTKFGPGGYKNEIGKWCKPKDFVPPDDQIRQEIKNQRMAEQLSLERCPCGGGQSCIVDRRSMGAWVHEDDVMKAAGLPVRKNCGSEPTKEQDVAMRKAMGDHDSVQHTETLKE
jgi:hypothetical protein